MKASPVSMRTVARALLFVSALLLSASASALAFAFAPTASARAAEDAHDAATAVEARLERIRDDPAAASDPKALDELARDVEALPPGPTRVQARMLIAEAWLRRLNRSGEALGLLRSVANDPEADTLTRALAARDIVEALIAAGNVPLALAEARERADMLDTRFVRGVERLARRKRLERVAGAFLVVFAALAAFALSRAQSRGLFPAAMRAPLALAPIASAFVAFVAAVGGALASRYESGSARPFLLLGALSLPLVLLARAWGAVGSVRPAARAGRALLCGAAILAAAFVLLDTMSPDYLEGFGL